MFGEEAAGNYGVMGRLMLINRLPVGGLGLLTVGFRITDRPKREVDAALQPLQVPRAFRHQGGHPHLLRRLRGLPPRRGPAHRRRFLCLFGAEYCRNTTRRHRDWRPRLQQSRGWEWLPHHVTKDRHPRITGIASAAKRDATVDGVYLAAPIGGEPGLVLVVDDFCTRGATLSDIARAVRESNPGWQIQPASLAKVERAAYWKGKLTNAHIPDFLDATWRGDPEVASPFY